MISRVVLGRRVIKGLSRLPRHVAEKLYEWVGAVGFLGLEEVRKIAGYHDEQLKGDRKGQRSIRLSRAYRALYVVTHDGAAEVAVIEEVTKHDY